MVIQINTQNLMPLTVDPLVQSDRRKYSTQPNANPAFILAGPTPDEPDVYTPPASTPTHDVDALLTMHGQQRTAADYIMGTIRDSRGLSGLRDPFATIAGGEKLHNDDPQGAAIDYLLGASSSVGAGDIFNLALTANGQGLETANLTALASSSGLDQPAGNVLAQLVHEVQQSNMATLLSLGGAGGITDRGFSDLI